MHTDLTIKKLDNGCIIQTSHVLNHDGYFRKCINGKCKMYHRYIWELFNNKIPKGYEVDHKCKNRECFNIDHLQLLTSSEHRTKDNTGRNRERKLRAKTYWEDNPKITGAFLAGLFNVSFSTGCEPVSEWKVETNASISNNYGTI